MSEGRGESQPAGHSPEFQSYNMRSGAVLNGQPGQGGPGRANEHENQAQSHRARPGAHHSNGHAARTEGALGVHDVLSGEDSAPDTGRAVTSPAPGSAPGVFLLHKGSLYYMLVMALGTSISVCGYVGSHIAVHYV